MIDDYQPSLVCIVETHAKRGRNPNTRLAIVLCTVMTDQQIVEEY